MDTTTEIVDSREETLIPLKSTPKENQYKTFDYFKQHTALLVTCVSGLVAIMSFVLHLAIGRMNYAYLDYWDIASLYANTNNQNELYMVICSLLYFLSLMLIHGLLSGTSEAFRYYNKLLTTMKQAIKSSKKKE